MATTFNVFHLGTAADIDPAEGDATAEDASSLLGMTFGSSGDPLVDHIQTLSPGSTGFAGGPSAGSYDTDNFAASDTYRLDDGPDQTHDSSAVYNATITYTDGTTATISAVVLQDTAGNLYLAPEFSYNADQEALEAKPLKSLTLNSIVSDTGTLTADRYAANYAVCFTSGTLIRTPRGNVLIDDLKVGDLVTTMDNGPQTIRWIGRRSIGRVSLMASPNLRPVLIPAGRLGNMRDMLVSPQHGLLLERDHLVRAIHAAKARQSGIRIANGKRSVTYIHLMFDAHQIIFAEGLPSESFYPGPMAQRVLLRPALRELCQLFPEVFPDQASKDRISRAYGDTARVFLPRRDVEYAFLREGWFAGLHR